MAIGSDVWLRSAEANIQLDGEVRVSKAAREYQPIGTLQAPRGSYTLKIGPVTRDFTVTRGEVRYIGTLDAELDIQARHTGAVGAGRGDPGHRHDRRHALPAEAPAGEHPAAADLGDRPGLLPDHRLPRQRGHRHRRRHALETGLAYLSSALSSELERTLIQDLGVPIDLIEIRPGTATAGSASPTQLAAGWQLGRKTFVTFNAGFCPDFSQISARNLGAGLEFRFSRSGGSRARWSRPSSAAAAAR